jgi:hypothetical protein
MVDFVMSTRWTVYLARGCPEEKPGSDPRAAL